MLGVGGAAVVLDRTQRDAAGYLMTSPARVSTGTYAVVSPSYRGGSSNDWFIARDLLGTVQVRVDGARAMFVGIGPARAVNAYLVGVDRARLDTFATRAADLRAVPGGPPASAPTTRHFWAAAAHGSGRQTLRWTPRPGAWRLVLMNADGSRSVTASVSVGAQVPHLLGFGIAALSAGVLLLLISGGGIALTARRR